MINRKIVMVIVIISVIFTVGLVNIQNVKAATTVTLSSPAQTETTVTLSWTQSSDLLFGNYAVTYSTSVNGPYTTLATITTKSQTTYAVTGLNPLTPYYFIVKDTDNEVITSSTSSSNTLEADTRANPTLSVDSSTQTTISLSWHTYNIYPYSTIMPFYGIVVQMSTNGQFSTIYNTRDVTQTTYTVTGLSPASTYQFQIYDQVGNSGQYQSYSNTESASTQSSPTPTSTIPEFPTTAVLGIFLVLSLFAVTMLTVRKRKISKK
jgi:hypothetical protein